MNLLNIAKTSQIVIAVLLILLTLIQSKSTGLTSGLKSSFSAYRSLRGVEKIVFILTIVCGVLLV
ncbi:preprotein translocase subunit SecG, partial [Patescibacteria group bacterium]